MTEDWMYQYPSTSVTTIYKGDTTFAERYHGDANKLLYELKNGMKFNRLGMNKMTRIFTDGTVITAKSHFGHDIVEIDVRETITITGVSCTITFIDLPDIVAPMKYPGEIHAGETEGVDYIKTYYTFDISNCETCSDEADFVLTFQFHTDTQIDYYDSELDNHCVYSQDAGCSGEVIEQGSDDDGDYIIWKVYTESSSHNRSGLGYVSITGNITDINSGVVVCNTSFHITTVDCCEKSGLEQPEIYWECGVWTPCVSDPIEMFGSSLGQVPDLISYTTLSDCIALSGTCEFFALPEIGGCLPYDWTLSGPGSLENGDSVGREVIYRGQENYSGCEDISILVKDRCGGEDTIVASCCQFNTSVSITYTTLQMTCDYKQTFYVFGGCAPYQWAISNGGSIIPSIDTLSAEYTAPSSNVDCAHNPTITLTDCCGSSSSIKLAVDCYTGSVPAYYVYHWVSYSQACSEYCTAIGGTGYRLDQYNYLCDGTFAAFYPGVDNACLGSGYSPYAGGSICRSNVGGPDCDGSAPSCSFHMFDGTGGWDCTVHPYPAEGQSYDCRTDAQKLAGCCPLNPYTGLPF